MYISIFIQFSIETAYANASLRNYVLEDCRSTDTCQVERLEFSRGSKLKYKWAYTLKRNNFPLNCCNDTKKILALRILDSEYLTLFHTQTPLDLLSWLKLMLTISQYPTSTTLMQISPMTVTQILLASPMVAITLSNI